VGVLQKLSRVGRHWLGNYRLDDPHTSVNRVRACRYEEIESRQLMTADVHVGAVYYDPASGLDTVPNTIQISFDGGAAGTQLTHLVIDGSKDGGPLTFNDAIFDTAAGGLGAYGFSPLAIVSHDGFQVTGSQAVDGGTSLSLDFQGFQAGMKLVLSIDVDQVLFVDPAPGDVEVDAVDEGAEFQRSHFVTSFTAPHYQDLTTSTQFWDNFDSNFSNADQSSGTHLDLPPDRYSNPNKDQSVLTAGAVAVAGQIPLPNNLAGVVFDDNNLNNHQDSGDPGIAGVHLTLFQFNGTAYVPTGATTITDSQGNYKFDNLPIGKYRVVETQPSGYFSVGAEPGNVNGEARGVVTTPDILSDISLLGGDHSVQNDFAEALPNSISGHVGNDVTGDCETNPNTPPIAGVVMHLLDGTGQVIATTTTDTGGNYRFDNLIAGTYTVLEEQPAGYLEDDAHAGSAGGTVVNDDKISQITLTTAIDAVKYDFCEVLPVSIAGYVKLDTFGDCETHPEDPPLAGVVIHLLDSSGKIIATTTTDDKGEYSFDNLAPDTYGVREDQPAGYFDGDTHVGSAGGTLADDLVTNIVLLSGVHSTGYNFCETPPASICGFVYNDVNNNGRKDSGEAGIANVKLILTDANGQPTGMTTTTDADGFYCFKDLPPGTYGIGEIQPAGYLDGIDVAGTAGGIAQNPGDLILGAVLTPGLDAEDYDFGELLPASISGQVHARHGNDCDVADGATPLSGVVMQLLDGQGTIVATTITDSQGDYQFHNLLPGTYSVREVQPQGYFDGDADVGSVGGDAVNGDLISKIPLGQGTQAIHYDFCEIPPGTLSGYVFQDGPPIVLQNPTDVPDVKALRDGKLTPDDTLLAGVTLELRDGVTGQPILGSAALPDFYAAGQPITTVTDAGGHYEFRGLAPGVYGVFDVKPSGFLTGIDTPGSLGGVVVSTLVVTDPAVLQQLVVKPTDDAIVGIGLLADYNSTDNNFSVVVTTSGIPFFVFPQPPASPLLNPPPPVVPSLVPPVQPPAPLPFLVAPVITRAGGAMYTWHLSVVDAGQPRTIEADAVVQLTSVGPEDLAWANDDLTEGEWILSSAQGGNKRSTARKAFGIRGGIPITGDFNGDGKTDIGVFKEGQWFIDLNDNGIWDEGDLWAKLGHKGDRPVTGDWDGDGKTDIGIFGPAWSRDPRAIKNEPGLPDPHNQNTNVHKNIPRPQESSAVGKRTMKLTSTGKSRADLIDHVFLYGTAGDHPAVGDWNGDGTHTIAVFRNGVWHRDTDGDGRWSTADRAARFGQPGDVPVVGDFNGDGTDELGVYRNGTWYIDTNGNGQIDAEDQVFEFGSPGDVPVVGDWNGDGKSEPGVYHDAAPPMAKMSAE
jgi:serine-aspartate repeat-containing protein C/D/E